MTLRIIRYFGCHNETLGLTETVTWKKELKEIPQELGMFKYAWK